MARLCSPEKRSQVDIGDEEEDMYDKDYKYKDNENKNKDGFKDYK